MSDILGRGSVLAPQVKLPLELPESQAVLLPNQLPDNMHGKEVNDGQNNLVLAIHVVNSDGISVFWPQSG